MWYNGDSKAIMWDIPEILLSLEEEILKERKLLLQTEINTKQQGSGDLEALAPKYSLIHSIEVRIQDIKSKRSQ
jgi:hypothetical protein